MKKVLIGFLAITLVMSFSMAYADLLVYTNVRPVAIGSTWDNPATQQLSQLLPMFNVNTDQQAAGYWQLGGLNPVISPIVNFEITANSNSLEMGIFSDINGDTDIAGRTLVDIFLSPAATGTVATITFNLITGEMTIAGVAGAVNSGTFSGITPSGFGFYIQPNGDTGSTFYSLDQLNGGLAQMVAFRTIDGSNRWTIGFEDLANTGIPGATDGDFNDLIFSIESITPVPEPATLLLLGLGLVGLAGIRRKFKS